MHAHHAIFFCSIPHPRVVWIGKRHNAVWHHARLGDAALLEHTQSVYFECGAHASNKWNALRTGRCVTVALVPVTLCH